MNDKLWFLVRVSGKVSNTRRTLSIASRFFTGFKTEAWKKVRLQFGVLQYLIWFQKPCITNPVFKNVWWWLTSWPLWRLPLKIRYVVIFIQQMDTIIPKIFKHHKFPHISQRFLTKNEISPSVFLEVLTKYLIRHTESQSITGKL